MKVNNLQDLLQVTRGAPNPSVQVVITHESHVRSQHLVGVPLGMNGMYTTQFDHARFDRLHLII